MTYFNSIKVQLRLYKHLPSTVIPVLFQFHKGTIKTQKILNMFNRAGIFQFHKGTIKTKIHIWDSSINSDFNSIKVQLRHKTIHVKMNRCPYFNSIKVQLRQIIPLILLLICSNFNSIKVQLRHFISLHTNNVSKFQFHKGTIKTHCFGIYNILVSNRICGCKVKKSY